MEDKDTTILSFSQIFLVVFLNKKMFYFFAFFSCVCRKIFVILHRQNLEEIDYEKQDTVGVCLVLLLCANGCGSE